jgi:hypothetical protein
MGRGLGPDGDQDIDLKRDQLGHHASESLRKLVGKAMLEVNVAPFDIADVAKTLAKSGEVRPFLFSAPRVPQGADPRSPACLRVREEAAMQPTHR